MNKTSKIKQDTERLCGYVLAQSCERESLLDDIEAWRDDGLSRNVIRINAMNDIWYIANRLLHKPKIANKLLDEAIYEAIGV